MNKKALGGIFGIVLVVTALAAPIAVAQEEGAIDLAEIAVTDELELIQPLMTAVISSNNQVEVERNIIFDGSESINPTLDRTLTYKWNFGDESLSEQGGEVVHSYGTPGTYTVTLTVSNGLEEHSSTKEIIVYSRLLLLFSDLAAEQTIIDSVSNYAKDKGQFIQTISQADTKSDYLTAQTLVKEFTNNIQDVRSASIVVVWTGGSASLGALSDFANSIQETTPIDFSQKTFIYVTPGSLRIKQRIAQSTFRSVKPERIILTRPAALHILVDTEKSEDISKRLAVNGIDFRIVNEATGRIGPLNFMSYLVDFMRHKGVPDNTIFLILMLPVIATVITFIRQVIGISTAGIYAPAIITISFIAMGLWVGILVFIVILVTSTAVRQIVKRFNIMYIPRMAVVLTLTTLVIFLLLLIGSLLDFESLISVPIFPLLILIAMAEKFLNIVVERGTKASSVLMGETLLVAIICYLLINEWDAFQTFMLAYPELVIVLIFVNIFIGRWTGLRLTEYLRFRQILTSVEHAEE